MAKRSNDSFSVLEPDLQISFYYRLETLRQLYLRDALKATVSKINLAELDHELSQMVPENDLKRVASFGLRGEVFFPTPGLLEANPFILGYYRLLYGISQKEFYNKGPFGRLKRLEENGEIPSRTAALLPAMCQSLVQTGSKLLSGLDELSMPVIHELQLLTVGPQLRGSENTRVGETATKQVMDLILDIVQPHLKEQTRKSLLIENASQRPVSIEFGSDPDVLVKEKLTSSTRHVVSIEIKGGADGSNIHNRLGEAEKSHLKAKKLGCVELWTILRVVVSPEVARSASPTTTKFFHLDKICNKSSKDYARFRESFIAQLGIRG